MNSQPLCSHQLSNCAPLISEKILKTSTHRDCVDKEHFGVFHANQTSMCLIHIWTKGEVGAPWNRFKPSSKIFLLTIPRRYFFCGSFVLFMSCVCHAFAFIHCCLVVTWRERADLLALVCDVYCDFVTFLFGILGQVWYFIVLILIIAVFLILTRWLQWEFQRGVSSARVSPVLIAVVDGLSRNGTQLFPIATQYLRTEGVFYTTTISQWLHHTVDLLLKYFR